MKEKKKLKFSFQHVIWLAVILQFAVAGMLAGSLLGMKILPTEYLVAFFGALGLFNLLMLLASKRTFVSAVLLVISLFLTSILGYSVHAINKVDKAVSEITMGSDEETKTITEMVIIVPKDAQVETVNDLHEFSIGYLAMNDTEVEAVQKVREEIDETVGTGVHYVEFEDMVDMVGALYNKTIGAMVMNKAYMELLTEIEGYENFMNEVKTIYSKELVSYIAIDKEKATDLDSFVLYFSGIDTFGNPDVVSRSDVNILAVVNTKTKHIQLINTPRDYFVELKNSRGKKDKLTHAGLYGVDNSIWTIENLYGIDIDFYCRMNYSGFVKIIDVLGGVDVYSDYDFTVEPVKHYKKGINHLTGIEALAFARERFAFKDGDEQRGRNQMAVISAMLDKVTSPEILYKYSEVLESVSDCFQTNMSSEQVYALVRMQLANMSGWTLDSFTVSGTGTRETTFSIKNKKVYVTLPDMAMVEQARKLIEQRLAEE